MFLPSLVWVGWKSLACGFGRRSGKGLFLCADGEALAGPLTNEGLVHIRQRLLERIRYNKLRKFR